jgi:hypothetical protein
MNIDDVVVNNGLSSEKFLKEIDRIVNTYNIDYMDAVIHFCEKNNIEVETAASIIRSNLKIKSKLQLEAENLNYLPKSAKLSFE